MSLSKSIKMKVPKQSIDKDKILDEKKEKMKELQQRFLSKSKELTKNNSKITVMQPVIQVTSLNKPKADNDTRQQLNRVNKKLDEFREKERRYKDTIYKLKNKLLMSEEELSKEKNNNIELSNKLEMYSLKIDKLEAREAERDESHNIKALCLILNYINLIHKESVKKDKKIANMQNNIVQLQDKVENLKNEIFNLQHGEDISKEDEKYYKKMISTYSSENAKLRQQLAESEQAYKQKVKKLINSDLVITQLKNQIETIKIGKGSKSNKKKRFGVLKTINSFVFFEDLDGRINPANIDYVDFKENAPCKVVIRYNKSNVAVVQKVYDDKDEFIKEFKESKNFKKRQKRKEALYEDVNIENNYNVLIIGSEKKREYSSILKRVGLNITLYDSYEGNVVRLKNMLNRHDIIICCVRHSRHYASHLMTYMMEHDISNAIKYNIIDNDNVENVIGRVRYVIENL